jgi:predicted CXXCH cytochrome family protein
MINMNKSIERLLIAVVFALLAAGVTLVVASAMDAKTNTPAQFSTNCVTCHTEYQMTWQNGAHGQAGDDPLFLADWESQGKPGACLVCHTTGYDPATATYEASGVTCEACHGPANENHPKEPMPVDRSTDLCGRCHSDTRFGWQDWTVSTHYQRGMDCATCHDPHSASLKTVSPTLSDNGAPTDEVSQLCINCHKEYSMDFSYTSHHQQGISCVDCHVKHLENDDQDAHTVPDHSFNASLQSCNTCHAEQMHSPTETVAGEQTTVPVQITEANIQLASVTPEPAPVSPIGFSVMAGLIGLAGGMVLAPWLERWYRHNVKQNTKDTEKSDE